MSLACHFIGDRYQMTTLLATGGMGQVWRARDLALDRPVAVKVLPPSHAADTTAATRFRSEARLSAGLTHPNIATVHDYGEVWLTPGPHGDRVAFLVMELVDGEPLSAVLRREGRLTSDRTMQILRQTAAGLAAAHAAGVVHRDVKPSNLLLGPGGTVKITDFGIAWSESRDPLTGTGEVMGTAQYLSPEQTNGAMAGPASDVYAMGLVAYECLAGRRPFDGANPVQVALMHATETPDPLPDHVPTSVRRLVERMLVKDPRERIADGAALLIAVQEVLAGSAVAPDSDGETTTVLLPEELGPGPAPDLMATGTSRRPRHATPRRRPSWRVVIPIVALLVLAGVVTAALAGAPAAQAPEARPTPSPTTALGIRVAAEDYVGRPVGEVQAELRSLGVSVRAQARPSANATNGIVLAVDPTGELSQGWAITVTYAVPPPSTSPADDQGAGAAGAPASGGVPTVASGSAATTATAPQTSAGPGNSHRASPTGRSNGRGHG